MTSNSLYCLTNQFRAPVILNEYVKANPTSAGERRAEFAEMTQKSEVDNTTPADSASRLTPQFFFCSKVLKIINYILKPCEQFYRAIDLQQNSNNRQVHLCSFFGEID